MKIVFLDVKSIGEDLDLSPFEELGEVVRYPFSEPETISERVRDADVLVLNKAPINEQTIYTAQNLKLVCVTGTGTNHLNKEYLAARNIAWRNVAGYSTESVTQHTFSMLFYLLEHLRYYDDYVRSGRYIGDTSFSHFETRFHQLHGMTWGIIGLGNIGRRVAEIAEVFGAKILYYSASGAAPQKHYRQVDFDTLLENSDIVSIHAPLNQYTENLVDESAFRKMKRNALFLNLGRGRIVSEQALAAALEQNWIAGAGLDVLVEEPMSENSPLIAFRDSGRLFITPHIGWASIEARTSLMEIIAGQIREFLQDCTEQK